MKKLFVIFVISLFLFFGCLQTNQSNATVETKTFVTNCVQGEYNANWTFNETSSQNYTFTKSNSHLTLICQNSPLEKLERTTKDWDAYTDIYLDELKTNLVESGFVNVQVELLNKSKINNGSEEGLKLKILLTIDGKSGIQYAYFNTKVDSINNEQLGFNITYLYNTASAFEESEVDNFVNSLNFVS